jgi:hypothetical protein
MSSSSDGAGCRRTRLSTTLSVGWRLGQEALVTAQEAQGPSGCRARPCVDGRSESGSHADRYLTTAGGHQPSTLCVRPGAPHTQAMLISRPAASRVLSLPDRGDRHTREFADSRGNV